MGGGVGGEDIASTILKVWRFVPSLLANQIRQQKTLDQQFSPFIIYFLNIFGFKVIVVVLNPVQWPPSYRDKSSALLFVRVLWSCGLGLKYVLNINAYIHIKIM